MVRILRPEFRAELQAFRTHPSKAQVSLPSNSSGKKKDGPIVRQEPTHIASLEDFMSLCAGFCRRAHQAQKLCFILHDVVMNRMARPLLGLLPYFGEVVAFLRKVAEAKGKPGNGAVWVRAWPCKDCTGCASLAPNKSHAVSAGAACIFHQGSMLCTCR